MTIRDGNDKLRETQMLATAEDDGLLHWKKLETPVIAAPPPGMRVAGFRDPCPWKEADGWYLGVGSGERGKGGCVLLYRSQDLRKWEYLHPLASGIPNGKQAANPCDTGEMWECPDFFPLGKSHYLHYSTENKVIWTTGDYDPAAHTYNPGGGRARSRRLLRAQDLSHPRWPAHPLGMDPGNPARGRVCRRGLVGLHVAAPRAYRRRAGPARDAPRPGSGETARNRAENRC